MTQYCGQFYSLFSKQKGRFREKQIRLTVVGRKIPPSSLPLQPHQYIHFLIIPGTLWILSDRAEDLIELRVLKEVYPESFRSKCSHMFLIREETETYSWEGDAKMKAEIGVMWPSTKECWQPPEAKRGKEESPKRL